MKKYFFVKTTDYYEYLILFQNKNKQGLSAGFFTTSERIFGFFYLLISTGSAVLLSDNNENPIQIQVLLFIYSSQCSKSYSKYIISP